MDTIQKKIRQRAKMEMEKLTDDEIFGSPLFYEKINSLIMAMVPNEKITFTLNKEEVIAPGWTDGSRLFASWGNELVTYYHDQESRYFAILGIVFHEIGHILNLDFAQKESCLKKVMAGMLPTDEPEGLSVEEQTALSEVKEALQNPLYRKLFVEILKNIENCCSDPHDEAKMAEKFGGFVQKAITFTAESLRSTQSPLETIIKGNDPIEVAMSMILQYSRFKSVFCLENETLDSCETAKRVLSAKEHIDKARETDSMKERYQEATCVLLALWPILKEKLENKQNQQDEESDSQEQGSSGEESSSGSSGNSENTEEQTGSKPTGSNEQGQGEESEQESEPGSGQSPSVPQMSEEHLQEILESVQKAVEEAGTTKAPTGRYSAPENDESSENTTAPQSSTEDVDSGLEEIREEIAEEKAEEQLDAEQMSSLQGEIRTANAAGSHKGVPVRTFTYSPGNISPSEKRRYDDTLHDLKSDSDRMKRQVQNELKYEAEDMDMYLYYGKGIDVNHAYRPDRRYFMNRLDPNDPPEMAIQVLLDMSGSMMEEREAAAFKAAVMLDDFARGLKIPTAIAGHTTRDSHVEYHVFTDFDYCSEKNKYNLAKMEAKWYGCNRDGAAIEIAASHLMKRPEQVKLLFIVSDGQPNHPDIPYGGDMAKKDIQEIVKKYKKQGIEMIACAIGGDKETIQDIYKESYLDITDLSKLPKALTGLIKKRIFQ